MPAKTPCPADNTIDVLVRGELPAREWQGIEAHFDECQRCRKAALEKLGPLMAPTRSLDRSGDSARRGSPGELGPGTQVGRHIVIERLGAGGMGTVYSAYDTTLERRIALKFLSAPAGDAAAAAKLVAEASAMARLSHPNVVTVHDVGVLDGRPYLAMEYVKGRTLREWRHERPRSVREILDVMAAVARGLEAAHEAGIIHRDVKPENVLVSGDRVLVTDFGVSVRDSVGMAGSVAGTPAYMAPEQFRGEPATPATDAFGFAVTLYEMLYEQRPFSDGSRAEIEAAVTAGQVSLPRARNGVSADVERLIRAGLSADPTARPEDMSTVAEALGANPGRRIRRISAGVVAAAAVGAAFWGGARIEANPERRCQAGAAVIDSVWGELPLRELRGRYRGRATAARQVAERRFQEYAEAWRGVHGETCTAAFADRRISGELFDLRMHCLERHRATFAALVGSLKHANHAQLVKVVGAPLPPVSDCVLSERPATKALPSDPAIRRKISEITSALADADARTVVGDLANARQLAAQAVDAAERLGYEPLLARALLQLATIEARGGQLQSGGDGRETSGAITASDRAVKLLERAIRVAEVGRADAERALAARALAQAHRDAGRLAEAEEWTELASSMITRVGDPLSTLGRSSRYIPSATQRAALHHARGRILYERRDWKAAAREFDRSLELGGRALGPRAQDVAPSMAD